MRFDDGIATVLAAEMSSSLGAQSMWRQLVDLAGQGRVPVTEGLLYRLRALRPTIPASVREASARALAGAAPPAPLVALFAEDSHAVAAPVLRQASLSGEAWIGLLPFLAPAGRAVLRHRRDLPVEVGRALAAYGSVDFVLSSGGQPEEQGSAIADGAAPDQTVAPPVPPVPPTSPAGPAHRPLPGDEPGFVSVASIAMGLPVVANALNHARALADGAGAPDAPDAPARPASGVAVAPRGPFEIADIVARIDAFQRHRDETGPSRGEAPRPERPGFRFETDMAGTICWVSGIARGAVIGVSISRPGSVGGHAETPQVDGVASGAFRRRSRFSDARLHIQGSGPAAGQWRISALPVFDQSSGRFMGYRGNARRPRPDEQAGPTHSAPPLAADSLRQLVHELRTPTTAIAGFAEMIDAQLLGPVPATYRRYAGTICDESRALLGAIDDLDTAARIEGGALELRPGTVPLGRLVRRVAADLAPLAAIRGAHLSVALDAEDIAVCGDDRAIERIVSRLMAALVASMAQGERVGVRVSRDGDAGVLVSMDRPAALAGLSGDALVALDAQGSEQAPGAPLLGTGFALRLCRNLAAEIGGSLAFLSERLTLRLPAALTGEVDRASTR